MSWITEQIAGLPAPEVILHIGAGACAELPHWQRAGAQRIILVEPNPELLPELQQTEQQHARVEIIPAAVATESGRRALKLFNFPLLNSLREPTGLHEILPGLAEIGQVTVDVLTPEKLVETTDLQSENINWLVIDTPGEEAAVINALEQHRLFNYFDRIIIKGGAESLYDGAAPAGQLTRQLEKLGYDIEGAEDTTDRDWPRYHLRLNQSAIECRRLRRENEALTEEKTALEKHNEELAGKLEQQKSETRQRAEELEAAQKQAEQQKKELTARNEALQERFEELEKTRQQAEQQAEKYKIESSELTSRLEKLNAEKATLDKQNEELIEQFREQKEQFQSENASVREELDTARKELQQQRSDLSVALRLQTLRENDLKELQTRYSQVVNDKEEQHDLLVQLHQRLSKAAEYLQLAHDEGSAAALPEKLREALVGEKEESGRPLQDD